MRIVFRVVVGSLAVFGVVGIVVMGLFVLGILASMNLEGGLASEEDQHLRNQRQQPPQWAADGTSIVFFHNGVTHIVDAAGSRLESLNDAIYPNVSPDGNRIAYTALERYSTGWLPWSAYHNYEIVSSELDGSDRRRLTETFAIDNRPVWSPDGTRIAFLSLNENYKETIHIVGADGLDARMVVPTIATMNLPAVWSSDGRNIAFLSVAGADTTTCRRDGAFMYPLHVVGTDGSEPIRVGKVSIPIPPAWSPDGRHIAFIRFSEEDCRLAELQLVAVDGPESSIILQFPVYNRAGLLDTPAWSPDGSEFLLGTFIFRADGSSFRTLPTQEGLASWKPDGSMIVVHLPSGVLYTVASDGADARVLVEQDEDGNLTAANGRPLNDARDVTETHSLCLELVEPGVLEHCDEN